MNRSRLVLNFPGFEPTGPEHQLDRIKGTAEKTGKLWNFSVERGEVKRESGANHAICEFHAKGSDWETRTRIVHFSWNDIIDSYERMAFPRGFFLNLPKLLAFFGDGTHRRYWRASKRYWAFTVWPLLQIGLSAIVSAVVATWLVSVAGLGGMASFLAGTLLTIILTLILCKWPGQRSHMLLAVNDWGFARDMVHRSNPVIEARYREFAEILRREIEAGDHDEIIVSGHSFGSVWAVAALALALEEKPDLIAGRDVTFLALGSSLLKIALAPDAAFMRDWTFRVWAQPNLFWHEIQTKDDIIAFYKSDPREELGVTDIAATMRIDRVNYKKAMERKRYRSMRKSFFRTHRQYILALDVCVPFDYMIRLFGPVTSRKLATDEDAINSIDPERALV